VTLPLPQRNTTPETLLKQRKKTVKINFDGFFVYLRQ
jgi:hypothetical protein